MYSNLRPRFGFFLPFFLSTTLGLALVQPRPLPTGNFEALGFFSFSFPAEAFAVVLVSLGVGGAAFCLFNHGCGRSSSSKVVTMLVALHCHKKERKIN